MTVSNKFRTVLLTGVVGFIGLQAADKLTAPCVAIAQAADRPPNILVIMADDVGMWNISAYHRGMMGGSTPNIDRIANEGALFTDYYAQQSCTAGRAAFILGQTPFRTGLLKVGLPAAIPFLLPGDETFDIGVDTRTGVNDQDYQVPFPFDGTINNLTFKLGPVQLGEADKKHIKHAFARAGD